MLVNKSGEPVQLSFMQKRLLHDVLTAEITLCDIEHEAETVTLQEDEFIPEIFQGHWLAKKKELKELYHTLIGMEF